MSHKKKQGHESHKLRNVAVLGILGATAWLGFKAHEKLNDSTPRGNGLPVAATPAADQGIEAGKYTTITINEKHGSIWSVVEDTQPNKDPRELTDRIQRDEFGGSSLVQPGDVVVVPNTPAAHKLHEQQLSNPDA